MAIPALQAARTACELSDWSLSNLELNKILYMAHMVYMGTHDGEPLVDENFQAWDYGPVLPSVYHKAKTFGGDAVKNVFHAYKPLSEGEEYDILKQAVDSLSKVSSGRLVAITHWKNGAWYKNYEKGAQNVSIDNADIMKEFEARNG